MTAKKIIVALALVLSAPLGLSSAALAQSAYTSGTIASSDRAGYPAVGYPSGGGYGSGLYAYAPGYVAGHAAKSHERRGRFDVAR
jgi:hypothetical protein